ncbi:MAG: ATP-binding protein [Planctomycetes bacterium]|nr:ATP-binding protein [Planctomycetota bacterium]
MTVNIPTKLDDWTYEVIRELAENYGIETDTFDFKLDLPDSFNLTKTCCSFANTKGGFVIIGVGQRNGKFEIKGIVKNSEIARDFGHKIKSNPTIYYSAPLPIEIPNEKEKLIYVFEIPLSPERPHIVDSSDKRTFYKRTNTGCEQMTYEEIRMSFLNYQERRRKINLLFLEMVNNRDQINSRSSELRTLDCSVINSLLSDAYIELHEEKHFINTIFTIRNKIRELNDEISLLKDFNLNWNSTTGPQRTEKENSVNKLYKLLLTNLREAISLLEKRFGFISPFEDIV